MTIPEDSYQTGIWEVSEKDSYEAKDAARDYHASRTVCLATQKRLPIYRFCFLVMLMPLFGYFFIEFWQADLSNYMAIISVIYTPLAILIVLLRKNLLIPAIGSLVYIAEMFRLDDWTAMIPTTVPIVILCAIAYFYHKEKRWLEAQPGFPDFHDIEVRVKEHRSLSERDVPEAAPAEDPYADVLSALQ